MIKNLLFYAALLTLILPSGSFAWGERGHDLVTRIAVQKLSTMGHGEALTRPFALRDHMLSHLSNVPDIHWRADYMSQLDRDLNYPTHFIGFEHLYENAEKLTDIELDFNQYRAKARAAGIDAPESLGTAPWRVVELHASMTASLRAVKAAATPELAIAATTDALLYAGLMSHFVGDLANPHHTTSNYNGQLTGNTGLHAYFEDDVVRALPFDLAAALEKASLSKMLFQEVLGAYPQEQAELIASDPRQLVFALALNSHVKVADLHALDNKYSVIAPSKDARTNAIRKPPREVIYDYKNMIEERIAVGASVLAQLWLLAWQQAGEPDLSQYRSYDYHIKPDFIRPEYLINE